jgi:radical SAM superfamily enzyme YgiQ (UPF0313 family)
MSLEEDKKMTENWHWMNEQRPHLDNPEYTTPEINAYVRDWNIEPWKSATKFCFMAPTPYGMMIANMGIAILYDQLNHRPEQDVVCERFYYPEDKLSRRLKKHGKRFFSLETCVDLCDFDVIGISSYFPQQMLLMPELMERSGLPINVADRDDSHPLVIFGGCVAMQCEPVYSMIDIAFMGQGEEVLPQIMDIIKEEKAAGPGWKDRAKKRICQLKGCYVPEYYYESFYPADHPHNANQIKEIGRREGCEFAPERIVKASIDMKKHEPLTRCIISQGEGLEMASGAQLIAVGCSNKCFFCNGSWVSIPYRERSLPQVTSAFERIVKNCGAPKLVPFSFNHSDFGCIKALTDWILNDAHRMVGFSSQRIDYFSKSWANVARKSGHRSITFAIEGGSEKMRGVINKNLNEAKILETFRTAFESGIATIKIYMISNLPFETKEDQFAIVGLLKKILKIREEVGARTKIRLSYTPFQAKNHTPFQWATPYTIWQQEHVGQKIKVVKTSREKGVEYEEVTQEDVGMPVISRNLNPVMDEIHPLGIRVRSSADLESAIVNQALCVADRRMARVIIDCYREKVFSYKGGMTVGRKMLQDFRKVLERYGLSFEYLFRFKDDNEVFPWDIISTGVTKEYLLKAWHLAKWQGKKNSDGTWPEGMEVPPNPFDDLFDPDNLDCDGGRVNGGIPPCYVKCTKCGVCTKGSGVVPIDMPNKKNDISDAELETRTERMRTLGRQKKLMLLLQLNLFTDFRFMHNSKKKMMIRAALERLNLPVLKDISLASDNLLDKAWISGVDYAEVHLHTRPENSPDDIKTMLNNELFIADVMQVKILDTDKPMLKKTVNSAAYIVSLPKDEFADTLAVVDAYNKTETFIVKHRAKGTSRDKLDIVERDVKNDRVSDIVVLDSGETWTVYFHTHWIVPPYDFLKGVFGTKIRKFTPHIVHRLDYFEAKQKMAQDMFGATCGECGNDIESGATENPISFTHCFKCLVGTADNDADFENLRDLLQVRDSGRRFVSPEE